MNSKLLVFDLGGVVIDIDFQRVARSWAQSAGIADWEQNLEWQKLGPRLASTPAFHRFERGEISATSFFFEVAQVLKIALTRQQWTDGWNDVFIGEYPDTQALLASVRERHPKVKIVALSNINQPHFQVTSTRFAPLLTHFDQVFYSHQLGQRKPDLACFELIARQTGVACENMLFFDDFKPNIEGALAAGLQAELYTSATLAHHCIESFLQ